MRLRNKRSNFESSICSDDVTETDSSQSHTASRESSEEIEWSTRPDKPRRSTRSIATPQSSSRKVAPSPSSTRVARKSIKRLKLSPCNTPLKKHTLQTDTLDSSSSDESTPPMRPSATLSSSLEAARRALRVSSVPDSLPGRETEFSSVYSFLRGKLTTGSGGCMYISGVPGTGKTATSLGVVRRLQNEIGGVKKIPMFIFSHLNGMQLARPEHLYSRLAQDVFGEKKKLSPDKALKLLDEYFSRSDQMHVVVILDEVDLLCTRKQTLLYNLFDWTARPGTRLTVLAIANTMDLPERAFAGRVASRLGLTRTIFQPYSFRQLQTIVQARLKEIPAFDAEAIELVSRKVAAVSGDARRALDICRRATELGRDKIGIADVDRALTEMFSSLKISAVKSASLMEQLFLRSVLSAVKESGLEEIPFQTVFKILSSLSHFQGLQTPSHTEAYRCLQSLVGSRLLLVSGSSKSELLQKINLNISTDDLAFALKFIQLEDLSKF